MKTTKDLRMYERYQAVRLVLEGRTRKETVDIIGRCEHTVGKYMAAYEANGLAGLRRGVSSGRPPRLTKAQRQALFETVTQQTPADVGLLARSNWTLALVAEWIGQKWSESYSLRGTSKLLRALGLSHTRPTYTLKKADPEKQRAFTEETFPKVKKTDQWRN